MPVNYNSYLIVGAVLSAFAALLHIGIIIGGSTWYRFFGAGERYAAAASTGRWWPGMVTLGIASVLGLWSVYAFSGAGLIRPLPLLKVALVLITAVYLVRGLAMVPALLVARKRVTPFLFWSSVVCTVFGVVHLLGLAQIWPQLG